MLNKYLIFAVALSAIFVGCTIKNVTYKTLRTTAVTVDTSVRAYFDGVAKGQYKTNGVPIVATSYMKFQIVYNAAVKAANNNPNTTTTDKVIEASTEVLTVVTLYQH